MHMADALLAPTVAATMYAATATAAGVSVAKLKKDAVVVAEYGDSGISNNADVDIVIYFTEWMSHRVFYSAQSWCRKTKTPHIYVSGAKNYDLIVDKICTWIKTYVWEYSRTFNYS